MLLHRLTLIVALLVVGGTLLLILRTRSGAPPSMGGERNPSPSGQVRPGQPRPAPAPAGRIIGIRDGRVYRLQTEIGDARLRVTATDMDGRYPQEILSDTTAGVRCGTALLAGDSLIYTLEGRSTAPVSEGAMQLGTRPTRLIRVSLSTGRPTAEVSLDRVLMLSPGAESVAWAGIETGPVFRGAEERSRPSARFRMNLSTYDGQAPRLLARVPDLAVLLGGDEAAVFWTTLQPGARERRRLVRWTPARKPEVVASDLPVVPAPAREGRRVCWLRPAGTKWAVFAVEETGSPRQLGSVSLGGEQPQALRLTESRLLVVSSGKLGTLPARLHSLLLNGKVTQSEGSTSNPLPVWPSGMAEAAGDVWVWGAGPTTPGEVLTRMSVP